MPTPAQLYQLQQMVPYGYPQEYRKYNTQYQGQKESIGWTWYDTLNYTTAVTTQLTFFNAIRATRDLSNMEVAGQLAAPKAFLLRAFRFFIKQQPLSTARAADGAVQTGQIANVALLINTGVLTLTIGAKEYGVFPLWMIPSGGGAYGFFGGNGVTATPGSIVDYGTSGFPVSSNTFTLPVPLFIAPQINFQVVLSWPAGAVAVVLGPIPLCVAMEGDLIRPVQ